MAVGDITTIAGSGQAIPTGVGAAIDLGTVAGSGLTESQAGRYVPQESGYWLIMARGRFQLTHNNRSQIHWDVRKNGTFIEGSRHSAYGRDSSNDEYTPEAYAVEFFDGSADYFEIFHEHSIQSASGSYQDTHLTAIFLGAESDDVEYMRVSGNTVTVASNTVTPQRVLGFTTEVASTDTSVMDLSGDDIVLKEAGRPYLILAGIGDNVGPNDRGGMIGHLQHPDGGSSGGGGWQPPDDPEVGQTLSQTYVDGDPVDAAQYNSSLDALWSVDVDFTATPTGTLVEAGGSGTGCWVGITGGDFVARWGNGSSGFPSDMARVVVTTTEYDFTSFSGTVHIEFAVVTGHVTVAFDAGSTGVVDYWKRAVAVSTPANWSGGDAGVIGDTTSSLAGDGIDEDYGNWDGTITEARLYNDPYTQQYVDATTTRPEDAIFHSYSDVYNRNSDNAKSHLVSMALVRPTTVDGVVSFWVQAGEDDGLGYFGTFSSAGWSMDQGGVTVVALPPGTAVAIYQGENVNQQWDGAATLDIDAIKTATNEDSSFSRLDDNTVEVVGAHNVFAYGGGLTHRIASSGTRQNNAIRVDLNGSPVASTTKMTYVRGDQGGSDHFNGAPRTWHAWTSSAGDDVTFQKFQQGGQDTGGNDSLRWAGAFLLDLSTLGAGAATFEGDVAQTLPAVSQDADGTHVPPAFTASIDQTLQPATQDATGTGVGPLFSGDATSSLQAVSQSAAGTASVPAYEGPADQTLQSVTTDAAGTHVVPTFSGGATSSLQPVSQDAAGTSEAPQGSGSITSSLPPVSQSAVGAITVFEWWNGTAWVGTEQWIPETSVTFSEPFPEETLEFSIAVEDETGQQSGYSLWRNIVIGSAAYAGGASQTLAPFSQAAAGTHTAPVFSGDADQTLATFTQAAAGAVSDPVFSGDASQTLLPVAQSVTGTNAPPVASGGATQALQPVSQDATGTFVPPVFTADITQSLQPISTESSGTVADPVDSGGIAQTLQPVSADAVGSHTAPIFSGPLAQTLQPASQDATGTVADPVGSGGIAQVLQPASQTAAGTHTPPVFTADVVQSLQSVTQEASGTVADPVDSGGISQTLSSVTQSAAGTHTAPVAGGSATQALQPVEQTAAGAVADPVDSGGIAQSLQPMSQAADGSVTDPVFAGDVAQSLSAASQALSGVHTPPVFAGAASSTLGTATQNLSGVVSDPVFSGALDQSLAPVEQSGAGEHDPPLFGTVDQTLQPVEQVASGTHAPPVFSGDAAQVLPIFASDASGTFTSLQPGDILQRLEPFTQSADGTHVPPVRVASVDQTLQPVTQSAEGTHPVLGTAAQALTSLTQDATGTHVAPVGTGGIAQTLQPFGQSVSGTHVAPQASGQIVQTLAGLVPEGAGYRSTVLSDSPIAYWPLDESLGATVVDDETASGNDGDYVGGPLLGAPGVVPGDTAMEIDPLDPLHQRARWGPDPAWLPTGSGTPWTISAWVRKDVPDRRALCGFGGANEFLLFVGSTNTTVFSGAAEGDISHANVADGEFHHFVFTYDGATITSYVDGVQGASQAHGGIDPSVGGYFVIGQEQDSNDGGYVPEQGWDGAIQHFSFLPTALTPARVLEHYESNALRVQDMQGTFTPPVYAGPADQTLSAFGQAAEGTHVAPTFTGDATSSLQPVEQSATGSAFIPDITGTASSSLGSVGQDATGAHVPPVFEGPAASTLPSFSQSATGTYERVFTGSATSTLFTFGQQAAGTNAPPVFSGPITQSLSPIDQQAVGRYFRTAGGAIDQTLKPFFQTRPPPPAERRLVIRGEARHLDVDPETRRLVVTGESRYFYVDPEYRVVKVPAENASIKVT